MSEQTMTAVYEKGDEPLTQQIGNQFYFLQQSNAEYIERDGLDFGYPVEEGWIVTCTYEKVESSVNEELVRLQHIITEHEESRERCDPRYLKFLDLSVDSRDFDSDENYFRCLAETTQRCNKYLKDGMAELAHQFHWNGDRLYRVECDEGEPLYFVTDRDPHHKDILNYDFLTSRHPNRSLSLAVSLAIIDDEARQAKKDAEKAFKQLIRQLQA